jgi:hypothetical protein
MVWYWKFTMKGLVGWGRTVRLAALVWADPWELVAIQLIIARSGHGQVRERQHARWLLPGYW